MDAKKVNRAFTAIAICILAFATAHASTIELDLTGAVSNGAYVKNDFDSRFTWTLSLSGLSPFTISSGDTIDATVNFDQILTIPPSTSITGFYFWLQATSFNSLGYETPGTTTFFLNGIPVFKESGGSSSSASSGVRVTAQLPPSNNGYALNSLTASFTVNQITPTTVGSAQIGYATDNPVPVPAGIWLLVSGIGALFAFARRNFSN